MKKIIQIFSLITIIAIAPGCEGFLDPLDENLSKEERLYYDPAFAEGFLINSYVELMTNNGFDDVNADDAVTNNLTSPSRRMATGEWSALMNPVSRWNKFEAVFYINKFINSIDIVEWKRDEETNELFKKKLLGEALAMRAIHHFYVLQAHAGRSESGELLGIPYYDTFIEDDGNFNKERLTFAESINRINADFEDALELLPLDFSDNQADVPPQYQGNDFDKYKFVFGSGNTGRVSGRIVKAFQAKLALMAASPSFMNGGGYWEKAANLAAEITSDKGGVAFLDPKGGDYYSYDAGTIRSLPELLWRSSVSQTAWVEQAQYPPSLNGEGRVNPSQNLVDAFPMIDGTPIASSSSYDPSNPFNGRDPRLAKYVLYNGNELGGRTINTGKGAGINAVDSLPQKSTRSGYYLKKHLQPNVTISNDGTVSQADRANVFLRYTEMFLILAEAANEIGGPDHVVDGMSARSIIGAIRQRAGIQTDDYLNNISSQPEMRQLIQNERRIELCFEGQRFWDLRRWGKNLNETVRGSYYNGSTYQYFDVEERNYPAYAVYAPIPYYETLKFSLLEQNDGW